MIKEFLIILSIAINTLGFSGTSTIVDRSLLSDEVSANASINQIVLPGVVVTPELQKSVSKPTIYANDYLLGDSESGIILNSKSDRDRVPIASTTKIMTAMIVLEKFRLDDVITISSEEVANVSHYGAVPDLKWGEKLTVKDLLYCLLLNSSNVSADAFADYYAQSEQLSLGKFVTLMNKKAEELGLKDTHYEDPAGLDETGYSTARDLFVLTKYALSNTLFAEIIKTPSVTVYDKDFNIAHDLKNSNHLLTDMAYPGIIGVKTGYMPTAGHCLVAAAERDGHTLITVVLHTNADTPTASAIESRKLLEWGFDNAKWK